MSTVYITNVVEGLTQSNSPLLLVQGTSSTFKKSIPVALTVAGEILRYEDNEIANATGVNLWSGSNPSTFIYMWFLSDKAVDLQFFGASMQFSLRTTPDLPSILTTDDIVVGNNTNELAADPPTENVAKIRLWNSSGVAAKYTFALLL